MSRSFRNYKKNRFLLGRFTTFSCRFKSSLLLYPRNSSSQVSFEVVDGLSCKVWSGFGKAGFRQGVAVHESKAEFAIIGVEPSSRERIEETVVCGSRDFI